MFDVFTFVWHAVFMVFGICAAIFVVTSTVMMLKDLGHKEDKRNDD